MLRGDDLLTNQEERIEAQRARRENRKYAFLNLLALIILFPLFIGSIGVAIGNPSKAQPHKLSTIDREALEWQDIEQTYQASINKQTTKETAAKGTSSKPSPCPPWNVGPVVEELKQRKEERLNK